MESSKNTVGRDTQTIKSSRRKSTTSTLNNNKIKKNNSPNNIVTSNLSSNNNNNKPKSPVLSKDVSRNNERKKSISGPTTTSNRIKSNVQSSSPMKKSKSGSISNTDDNPGTGNLVNKKPPKLNLAFKNNRSTSQQFSSKDSSGKDSSKDSSDKISSAKDSSDSGKDSSGKNSTTKVSPNTVSPTTVSSPPLLSPKIIELRKSESFQSKSSTKENSADDSSKVTSKVTSTTAPKKSTSLFASKSHRVTRKRSSTLSSLPKAELNKDLLARLEQQNSLLPPQDSTQFLLARLERQNDMLDSDPKSVCIESNVLKANLDVVQSLINGTKTPEIDIDALDDSDSSDSSPSNTSNTVTIKKKKLREPNDEETKKIDWDFWTALIQDYTSVATKLPHLLAAKLQQGLPTKLRGLIWQSMSQASSTYLETMYSQLLSESSPYDKIIQRDLARTFPGVELFKEENGHGQTMLWNILKAYSLYDPLVGYCQGLGFLVGPLLMNMSETQAFCVFVRLMETYDMRTMFTLNMEGLQQRLYQFSCLLSQILPQLHSHFQLHGIQSAMYASQWFLSLFAYTYPLPLVFRIYDVVFAEGAPETIMRVAIALLKKNEEKLLELGEFEDLLDFLTSRLYETYNNEPTGLIKDAMELSSVITKGKLDELSDSYVHDMEDQKKRADELVAVRFNERFNRSKKDDSKKKRSGDKRWSFNPSLPNSRHSIATMQNLTRSESSSSTSSDASSTSSDSEAPTSTTPPPSFVSNGDSTEMLHQQIEDLVTALSNSQKEHAEVTEQLVSIKMEKIDLVNEVEALNNRLRGMEKENKRMSIDSSMTLNNDEGFDSERSTRIASPVTPNPDQKDGYDQMKNFINYIGSKLGYEDGLDKELLKSRRLSAPATSLTEYQLSLLLNSNNNNALSESKETTFGLVKEWNEKSKEQYSLELALTEELIQVKQEKFELMLENKELVKRNCELENALENSHQIQKSIQDKNDFLRTEIERLDEESTQALYEQNSLKEEIKAIKHNRIEHIRSNRENEKLKKELENVETRLRQYEPDYMGNNDWVTTMEEIEEIIAASSTPKSTRRVSFLKFFGTPNGSKSSSDGNFFTSTCTGENCPTAKKCDDLEKMLKHVKMLLVDSERARDQMSTQLEELNSMLNGFGSLGDIDDIFQSISVDPVDPIDDAIEEKEVPSQQKSKSEKRLSTSLASFFGAS